jgi:serine/threonine protein phosphatase PrpC
VREEVLVSGDLFLITSDGLHGVVEEEAIGSIAGSAGSTEQCAERLVQAARSAGAPDNISVVALRYE